MLKTFCSLLCNVLFFSAQALEQHQVFLQFATARHQLSPQAQADLQKLLNQLPQAFDFEISIAGHTDDRGTDFYNKGLAQRRALAVKDFLVGAGVSEEAIAVASYGEWRPLQKNTSAEARQKNRRVEVRLTIYKFENVEELEAVLAEKDRTRQIIDANSRTTVEGKHGMTLHLPAGAFVDETGAPYTGPVLLELQEALEIGQFITNQLYTQSEDQVLISGGMFKISATTEEGVPLQLDSGQSIYATVPTPAVDPQMQQFTSSTGAVWQASDQPVNGFLNIKMPPRPTLQYNPSILPQYEGYKKPKPVEPEIWVEPRRPEAPDPVDFEPEIAFYQKPLAARIKRKAAQRLQQAQREYEEKLNLYQRKKDLYDDHEKNYALACEKYQQALVDWQAAREEDSLAFLQSEDYLLRKASNKVKYLLALEKYRKKVDRWEDLRATKMDSALAELDEKGIANEQMMNSYITSVSKLKWINIDRFWKMRDSQRQMVVLNDADEAQERVFIVFKNLQCVLPMKSVQEGRKTFYQMDGIPKDERFAFMAYRVENGKPQVYLENFDPRKTQTIQYREVSFKEFRALLEEVQA